MNLTKTQWIVITVLGAVVVWYFFLRKKDTKKESGYGSPRFASMYGSPRFGGMYGSPRFTAQQESNFKLPRWIKLGGCRPCIGSLSDGCCGGCLCKDAGQL